MLTPTPKRMKILKKLLPLVRKYGEAATRYLEDGTEAYPEDPKALPNADEVRKIIERSSSYARMRGESEEFISDMEAFMWDVNPQARGVCG